MSNDDVSIRETVGQFRKRNGIPTLNDTGRVTTGSFATCSAHQRGRGYLCFVKITNTGSVKRPNVNTTVEQTIQLLNTCSDRDEIYEIYPTRFCVNEKCGKASWGFLHFPHKGHSTCKFCGYEQRLVQSNMDSRHLGEDEKVNKNQWNCTPGMTANDCTIVNSKGKRIQVASQRIPSHLRNYWRMLTDIDDIADGFDAHAAESIARLAKSKCKQFYYNTHDGDCRDDDQRKMPHGRVQFAAACFYAAALERETNTCRSCFTLASIQRAAAQCIERKPGRRTRDVTVPIIIRYTKLLKSKGLCGAIIPEITANTLHFQSANTAKEHTRLAIFNKCTQNVVHLPSKKPWGIQVVDTERGVLMVDHVSGDSASFRAGLKKGDYIFQVADYTVGVDMKPTAFGQLVTTLKTSSGSNPHIKVNVMREKK